MPRKKTPTTQKNEIDELIDQLPSGNGFDAAGLLDAAESGDLDALDMRDALSGPPEQQAADGDSPEEKPAPKKRSRSGTRKRSRRPRRSLPIATARYSRPSRFSLCFGAQPGTPLRKLA